MHEQIGNLQAEKRAMGVSVAREDRPEGGYLARLTIDNAAKLNSLNRELVASGAPGAILGKKGPRRSASVSLGQRRKARPL
jgi:hypothetical protein